MGVALASARDEAIAEAVSGKRPSSKGWVRVNCPFCDVREGSPDRKASFGLNVRTLWFQCYRCSVKGRLGAALDEFDYLQTEDEQITERVAIDPPEGMHLLDDATLDSISLRHAWDFLLDVRRMTIDEVVNNRIGACISGRFAGRIIIPVFDSDGLLVWYIGRQWVKKCDKPYLYPIGDRHGAMFNHGAIFKKTDVPVMIVEGAFDAIPYAPDAVAALGKITDDRVLDELENASRPVVFVPDADEAHAGYAAAMRMRLRGKRSGSLRLQPKMDPDEIMDRTVLPRAALRSLDTLDPVTID